MTNFKKYLFVIALLLGSFSITQAQSAKELITKKWQFSFDDMMEHMKKTMTDAEKQELANMPDAQKEMMKKMIGKMTIHFKSDGTCQASAKGKETNMKWKISDDGKTVTTTDPEKEGKENVLQIVELSSKKLLLKEAGSTQKMVMVFVPAEADKD